MLRQIERAVFIVTLLCAAVGCSAEPRAAKSPRAKSAPPSSSTATDAGSPPAADAGSPPAAADAAPPPTAAADLTLSDSERCPFGCDPAPSPLERETVSQEHAPPALSGGTLLTTRDGKWLVAADPDRDRLYFVDLEAGKLSHVRELSAGAEPGRLIEDAEGRIHVALRGAGALLTLTRAPDSHMTQRPLCTEPRGLAYDGATKEVHMACAGGELVSIAAEPSAHVFRELALERDLRDVLVRGQELLVTRFRSAEMLRIGSDGNVKQRAVAPTFVVREFSVPLGDTQNDQAPNVARRTIDIAGKGSAMLHQRSRVGQVVATSGYRSSGCSGIIQSAITVGLDAERTVSADLANVGLAVDIAASPNATLLAVVGGANVGTGSRLAVISLTGTSPLNPNAPVKPLSQNLVVDTSLSLSLQTAPFEAGRAESQCIVARSQFPTPRGEITSVSFVSDKELALFEREPAAISVIDLASNRVSLHIDLAQDTRRDTGYELFHMLTSAGIACASCHAEAGDDAHVWVFEDGPRRTPSLRGGILGSEPFHWDGAMTDFDTLVSEVFTKRMAGGPVPEDKRAALAGWLDAQRRFTATRSSDAQLQHGRALFESAAVGCASCHSGPLFTNNQTVDVGTGRAFQVPALRGVSFRLPVMHDGCAHTLEQRFDAACGGSMHGNTAGLSAADVGDLVAYLNTL